MHHLVVGEFVFDVGGGTPISKFKRVISGRYSEVSLVDGADLEDTGLPLQTIDISASWLKTSASQSVNELIGLVDSSQQVSDGRGFNLGRWVIKQISETRSNLIHDGRAMKTEVSIQFMEDRDARTSKTR
ncbi:phage tail protein [Vibrio sp. TRT 17S01]|uniref:phage tail protein n=1 Tax=Vibrio sp. TRT 17S01 TaxID=3418505 RepID=UPI003CE9E462